MEWIAHRGESRLAPENTLAAFALAWERGADALELDVHLTQDRQLVVCHDADTLRTCGVPMTIKDRTLAELRRLDAGLWKGKDFQGEKLPILPDVLATIPPGKRVLIEIKCGIDAADALARVIAASGKSAEQIALLSFQIDVCCAMKRALARNRCFLLSEFQRDDARSWAPAIDSLIERAAANHLDGLGLQDGRWVDARATRAIHAARLKVAIWTIDEPQRAKALIALGVDGIITNRCSRLRAEIERGESGISSP